MYFHRIPGWPFEGLPPSETRQSPCLRASDIKSPTLSSHQSLLTLFIPSIRTHQSLLTPSIPIHPNHRFRSFAFPHNPLIFVDQRTSVTTMATNGSAARSPESSDHFEFPGALPSRRLFSDGNGSRPRSLSQSGPTPRYIFTGPAHWPIQPVPQVPSEVAASVFAEVCGEAAWSPLKGDPNPYRSSSGTLAAVAPVGDSSKLNVRNMLLLSLGSG